VLEGGKASTTEPNRAHHQAGYGGSQIHSLSHLMSSDSGGGGGSGGRDGAECTARLSRPLFHDRDAAAGAATAGGTFAVWVDRKCSQSCSEEENTRHDSKDGWLEWLRRVFLPPTCNHWAIGNG